MEDHNNYFIKKRKNEEDGDESRMLNAMTAREKDSLLIHLVKGYPHLYDKESKDFKDIIKRNNSWKEIGEILNTTGIEYIFLLYQYCVQSYNFFHVLF